MKYPLGVSQCKHIKAIATICCLSLSPPLSLFFDGGGGAQLWALVRHEMCVAVLLLLRNTSPSSDWGQWLLSGVIFKSPAAVIALSACDSGPVVTVQLGLATTSGSSQ